MKVGLVIPWRPQPTRVYAFEATMNRYSDQLPGVTAYYGDTDDEIDLSYEWGPGVQDQVWINRNLANPDVLNEFSELKEK
jgi:hypothetical protein